MFTFIFKIVKSRCSNSQKYVIFSLTNHYKPKRTIYATPSLSPPENFNFSNNPCFAWVRFLIRDRSQA